MRVVVMVTVDSLVLVDVNTVVLNCWDFSKAVCPPGVDPAPRTTSMGAGRAGGVI